jgi:hypothetical protein
VFTTTAVFVFALRMFAFVLTAVSHAVIPKAATALPANNVKSLTFIFPPVFS